MYLARYIYIKHISDIDKNDIYYFFKKKYMRILWKMKVSEKKYNKIIQETESELKEINQDLLINWEEEFISITYTKNEK